MEIEHNWTVRLGLHGRGLKKRLPLDLWTELENTSVGTGNEENWAGLFMTIDLFRKVTVEVGNGLEYADPFEMDRRVVAYLDGVREMERQAGR